MDSDKTPDESPGWPRRNLIGHAWRLARLQIAAALAAYAVTTALVSLVPLLTALTATLTYAAVVLYGSRDAATAKSVPAVPGAAVALYTAILTTAGVSLGAWMLAIAIGSADTFFCGPSIPWRIEIALFGSFIVGIFSRMAHRSQRSRLTYLLILLALFWIAPFYGYFSGSVFLAFALVTDCVDRPSLQIWFAALGMGAGNVLGNMLAGWLLGQADERGGLN